MATGNGDQAVLEERTSGRRIADPELIAMHDVLAAVADLDVHSQYRVLTWAKDRVDDKLDTERTGAAPLAE